MELFAFRRNLVLAASAGTGKTYTLVGVLLHLLLGLSELGAADDAARAAKQKLHPAVDPARIVATTFSRKAAAEIRGRLAGELEKIALAAPSLYRAHFDAALARVGREPLSERELSVRARRALERLGHAQIGTLHSFATSLVRSHALELGLPPSFDLASEDETRARAVEVIGETVATFAEEEPEVVRDLVRAAGSVDRVLEDLFAILTRLDEDGRAASHLAVAENDADLLSARLEEVVTHARSLASDERYGAEAEAVMAAWGAGDEARLAEAVPRLFGLRRPSGKNQVPPPFFDFRDALPGAGSNPSKGSALVRAYRARHAFAPRGRAVRDLLVSCDRAVRRDRHRRGELAFGDVLRAARDLLRDHPPVAADVGGSFDALLVDEFQDTSRLQRELVELLWERDPAKRVPGALPGLSRVRGHGLFVVGDRKQSIYGFRGADVAVFAELCVGLAGERAREALGIPKEAALSEPETPLADLVPLQHNRRGEDELLEFANAFSAIRLDGKGGELFAVRYVPETEDLRPPPERAKPKEPRARTAWLRPCIEVKKTRTAPLDEAYAIADRIQCILHEGRPLVRGAPPSPRDIAVLAHTNGMLETCAYALAEAKIPYVVAGRGFYSAREVLDVVAFLALLVRPDDRLAFLTVLRGVWGGVSDEALLSLGEGKRGLPEARDGWDRALRAKMPEVDRVRIACIVEVLERLRRNVDRFPPEILLREAVRELELEEALVRLPRGDQRVANVEKLLVVARREPDARVLLERLEEACERDAMETEAATFSEEDDAVRLLTVHASKGLDFPIVFVPEAAADPPRADSPTILVDLGRGGEPLLALRLADETGGRADPPSYTAARERERARLLAERARLSYVAVTRASDAMFLVGDRKPPKGKENDPPPAFRATVVGVLTELARDSATRDRAKLDVVDVGEGASAPRASEAAERRDALEPPPPLPSPPAWGAAVLATTSLQDFHHCPRRFQLAHLLDLPERDLPTMAIHDAPRDPDAERTSADAEPRAIDPRAEGSLTHRVLELVSPATFGALDAEAKVAAILEQEGVPRTHAVHRRIVLRASRFLNGSYAAELTARGASLFRELPFVLPVRGEGRVLALRGTIDLLAVWPDGRVDVVDYKRARGPSIEPHAFQLAAYTLAARALHPDAAGVRAGIVFLGGDAPEPRWQDPIDPERASADLFALATRLVDARWSESFPRVTIDRCKKIHCGYVAVCHPAPRVSQLPLFRG